MLALSLLGITTERDVQLTYLSGSGGQSDIRLSMLYHERCHKVQSRDLNDPDVHQPQRQQTPSARFLLYVADNFIVISLLHAKKRLGSNK